MTNVVLDNLSYFMTMDKDVMVEGYDGFIVEENMEGKFFVIYKDIIESNDTERKFILPKNTLNQFLFLYNKFTSFFEKQKILFKMLIDVEKKFRAGKDESLLKEICEDYYSIPQNYIKFVAMNLTKNQFYILAKERILKRDCCKLLN